MSQLLLKKEISELELEELALAEKALDSYQNQSWDSAKNDFRRTKTIKLG